MTWREASLYSPPVGDHRGSQKAKTACPAQARPSRNLLSLRPHPPTLAIIPATPPTLCPPPFKSLCQIREVMYRYTYLCVPSPFLSCSLLSLHPFMPTCQQRGKDKSPCPCFLPTKAHLDSLFCYWPLWLADYALGILQVHTPLLLWIQNGLRTTGVLFQPKKETQ